MGARTNMKKLELTLKNIPIFVVCCLSNISFLHSNSPFEAGLNFLQEKRPLKAIESFNEAIKDGRYPKNIYLYVGLSYLKIGEYSKAIDSFAKGKCTDNANFHIYSFNMGNAFFAQNRFYDAEISYNEALASTKPYPPALLNRANTRMKIGRYAMALKDYKEYLTLFPNDVQKEEVQQMILALERIQLEEETAKADILSEATKKAEEAMRRMEEERQKRLLEELNASLSSVDNADSVSSGTEDTINYEEENELD